MRAFGDVPGAHGVVIDRNLLVVVPDRVAAGGEALQMMDRTVYFENLVVPVAGLLELAVDVGGDHEGVQIEAVGPLLQKKETAMRFGVPVEVGAVAVKPPAEGRITLEV